MFSSFLRFQQFIERQPGFLSSRILLHHEETSFEVQAELFRIIGSPVWRGEQNKNNVIKKMTAITAKQAREHKIHTLFFAKIYARYNNEITIFILILNFNITTYFIFICFKHFLRNNNEV